jgi:hypothetical protein
MIVGNHPLPGASLEGRYFVSEEEKRTSACTRGVRHASRPKAVNRLHTGIRHVIEQKAVIRLQTGNTACPSTKSSHPPAYGGNDMS